MQWNSPLTSGTMHVSMTDDPQNSKPEKPKKKELTVVPHPADQEDISAEMADLFDEETVKHQHGHAEPESD